jgi:hypothetical protein
LSRLYIHRKYLVVGAVDQEQQVVLPPRRFGFEAFSSWATTHLGPSDAVVLEATSNAWLLYDELKPLVGSITVAHPLAVKLIAAARVKTDSRDTIKLAHLLAASLVPAVWVPPVHVRELRALVNHRILIQLPGLGMLSVMSPPSGHRRYHALPFRQKAGRLCRARSQRP